MWKLKQFLEKFSWPPMMLFRKHRRNFSGKFQKLSRIFLKIWMTLLSSWNVFWKSCSGHVGWRLEVHAWTFSKSFHVFNAELPKKKWKTKLNILPKNTILHENVALETQKAVFTSLPRLFFEKSVINFCSRSEIVRTVSVVFEKKNCPKEFL